MSYADLETLGKKLESIEHAIEDFHLLDRPVHILFVTGVIAGPVFEQGEIISPCQTRQRFPRLPRGP